MARVSDTSTLAGAMHELDRRGFVEHFMLTNGCLLGLPSGKKFRPDEISVSEVYRFEGASDPDDMSVLYALETRSGLHGTLADAFGVYADPGVGAFMKEVAAGAGASVPGTPVCASRATPCVPRPCLR